MRLIRKLPTPSPSMVVACISLVIALGTGGAYAANTVFSDDIADGEVKRPDIALNAITTGKIVDATISTQDYKSLSVTPSVLAPGAVTTGRLAADAVTGDKVADDSLTAADIDQSSLAIPTVLWAVVGSDVDGNWSVQRGRGAVSATWTGSGSIVYFDRDVTNCAFFATPIGERSAQVHMVWPQYANGNAVDVQFTLNGAFGSEAQKVAFHLGGLC